MSDKTNEFRRMDFVVKVVSSDDKSKTLTLEFKPDPKRYEWREINGELGLYDKLDNVFFPEQVFVEGFNKLAGKPIYFQPQMLGDAKTYIKSRQPHIMNMLEGHESPPTFKDESAEFLQSLVVNNLEFVIISLDIVSSTKLATSTDPKTYARLIHTVLYELSEVVPKFHGHVLKYTGDGLIAYFAAPSFISKNDLAIDCALTLRGLVYDALNPIFDKQGFSTIDIKIGMDAGEAHIETIGSPATKQHKDIIGAVVNLAAKIQSVAKPGEIYMGDTTLRNLHTKWRQLCEPVNLESNWDYKDSLGNVYRVHRIILKK